MKNPKTTTQNLNPECFRIVGIIFAVATFIGYSAFIFYLITRVEGIKEELHWTRFMTLFTSIQAIVLAAAGFIFGKETNNIKAKNATETAENEKKKKENAEEKAEKAQQEADKGKRIATAILNTKNKISRQNIGSISRTTSPDQDADEFIYLNNLVKELYPNLDN